MEYRLIDKRGLGEFIGSEEFLQMPFIPITRHRALSQLHNPRAEEGDIFLILALEHGQLAGYTGVLPDFLYCKEGPVRTGWLTTLWVHPSFRGRGLGTGLIRKALEAWNQALISADYVPHTGALYVKTDAFGEPLILEGIRIYVRMDLAGLLPPRSRFLRALKPILTLFDTACNLLLDRRFLITGTHSGGIHYESVDRIDTETEAFIGSLQENALCRRGAAEINWLLNHPWVVTHAPGATTDHRYHFSSSAACFGYHCFRLRNTDGSIGAFFILSLRNRTLKIPVFYAFPEMTAEAARVISAQIVKWRVNTFTTFQPELAAAFRRSSPGILTRRVFRKIMVSTFLRTRGIPGSRLIQDGDGDLGFT